MKHVSDCHEKKIITGGAEAKATIKGIEYIQIIAVPFCSKCCHVCEPIAVFKPPKESEGEMTFREYNQKCREEIIKGYPTKEAKDETRI